VFKPKVRKIQTFVFSIATKIYTVIKTAKYLLWVVQICSKQIQDGGRAPSLKIEKLLYLRNGLTDFDEIWYDDASRPRILSASEI